MTLPRSALGLVTALVLAFAVPGIAAAATTPTAPQPVSPSNNADVVLPFTISWSAATDASGIAAYNWQVSGTSTFGKVLRQDSTMGVRSDTVSGLSTGTYYWRVQAVSNDMVQGPWSTARSFRVRGAGPGLPGTPQLNSPRGGTSFHPWEIFGMSWSAVSGTTKYVLEASKDSAFPASGVVFRWESDTPSTTIVITTVDMGSYYSRVFAVNADGVYSMPSNAVPFSISFGAPIAAAPTIVAPTGNVTTSLPITFKWNHVINPQPSGYELQFSTSSSFSTIEEDIPQLNGPEYTVINLPTTGPHFWRVRSFQGMKSDTVSAATAWSTTGTFTIASGAPKVASITLTRPSPASGQDTAVDLQLTSAVPSSGGTITLKSSNATAAPVPASVAVQGSTSWTEFFFTAGQVTAPTSVTLTATINSTSTTTTFTVSPPSLASVDGLPFRTSGGPTTGAIVMLNGQAPAGGAVVSVTSSSPAATAPASVTVPAGSESASFSIATKAVTQDTPVTISATWKGVTVQAQTTLTPQPPPTDLTLDPTVTSSQSGSFGTVSIAQAADQDVTFALSSSRPDIASVPGSVQIGQFGVRGGFNISTQPVTQTTVVTISVTGGGVTKSANLTIEPVLPSHVSTLKLNPATLKGGGSSIGTVTLSAAAPSGGLSVTIASDDPSTATVPASITIPAGATSGTFSIKTTAATVNRSATISARGGGVSASAVLFATAA